MSAIRYLFRACLALGLWLSAGAAHALIISEYVEGSSNNKAIEITNLEAGSTRWTGVELRVYSNGSSTPTTLVALGDLDLMPGQSYVVAHASAAATLTARAQRTVGGTWFNGNDAVELRVAGARRDLLGQIGTDPDPAVTVGWSGGGVQTVDRSLRRRASVCTGVLISPASFNPSTQWTAAARDDFSDLGSHAHACLGAPVATAIGAVQGSGARSPRVGAMVVVEGVLTGGAMTSQGDYPSYSAAPALYLQAETADTDPATSDGIAVHAPMLAWNAATRSFSMSGQAGLPLGALLRVTGVVEEFHARNACASESETRCETRIRASSISVIRPPTVVGGVIQLPPAVDLSTALPADLAPETGDAFERFEGVRVSSGSQAFVSGASKYFDDNPGPYIGVDLHPRSQATRRLVRERGAYALGLRNWMGRGFTDANAYPPNVAVGARLQPVAGPLAYDYDAYRLVAQPGANWALASARAVELPAAQPAAGVGEFTVATFNARQFGVDDNPTRVPKLVRTVQQLGCPSVLALEEVATPIGVQGVTDMLTPGMQLLKDQLAAAGCTYEKQYASHPDIGEGAGSPRRYGIALLMRPGFTVAGTDTWQICHPLGSSAAASYDPIPCAAGSAPLHSRRPVVLRLDSVPIDHRILRADGSTAVLKTRVPLTIVGVHLKSQLNAADDDRRAAETEHLAARVRTEHANGRQVIVLGDFNTPHRPAPESRFLAPLRDAGLVATWDVMDPWQRFSSNFRGVSGVLDHILLSRTLYAPVGANTRTAVQPLNSDWPARGEGLPGAINGPLATWAAMPIGASDHDPVWLKLGGQALHPEFQAGVRECLLAYVCAVFHAIGGNPAACGSRRTASKADQGADPLEAYRLFRDRWLAQGAGKPWQQLYYDASPAMSDLVAQDPALGVDLLILMLRFGDTFERAALGQAPDLSDLLDRADLERLQRVHTRAQDKLPAALVAPLAVLIKPSGYVAFEGQSTYALLKHLMLKAGVW